MKKVLVVNHMNLAPFEAIITKETEDYFLCEHKGLFGNAEDWIKKSKTQEINEM